MYQAGTEMKRWYSSLHTPPQHQTGSTSLPGRFTPGKIPGTHVEQDRWSLGADHDRCAKCPPNAQGGSKTVPSSP
jgi:hypothetical protein